MLLDSCVVQIVTVHVSSVAIHVKFEPFQFFLLIHLFNRFLALVLVAVVGSGVGLVVLLPVFEAEPAELLLAFRTDHKVAALVFLDGALASWAAFCVVHLPEVVQFVVDLLNVFVPLRVGLAAQRLVGDPLAAEADRRAAEATRILLHQVIVLRQEYFFYQKNIVAVSSATETSERSFFHEVFEVKFLK